MSKEVRFSNDARQSMLKGVNALSGCGKCHIMVLKVRNVVLDEELWFSFNYE